MLEHTLPDHILDTKPELFEVNRYAQTIDWKILGVELKLYDVKLGQCTNCTDMYQWWLQEKNKQATRRNLIDALRDIKLTTVADNYVAHLQTIKMVSDTVKDNLLNIFLKLHC